MIVSFREGVYTHADTLNLLGREMLLRRGYNWISFFVLSLNYYICNFIKNSLILLRLCFVNIFPEYLE